jgi:hypothetical protein
LLANIWNDLKTQSISQVGVFENVQRLCPGNIRTVTSAIQFFRPISHTPRPVCSAISKMVVPAVVMVYKYSIVLRAVVLQVVEAPVSPVETAMVARVERVRIVGFKDL